MAAVAQKADADMLDALRRMGLAGADERPGIVPLEGGVSSDIVRVDLASGPICVKRALSRLKVAAVWTAPVERNAAEAEWFRVVERIAPGAAPRVLGEDRAAGLFAMPFLSPEDHPVWKTLLRDGTIDATDAEHVGRTLAAIHSATANDPSIAAPFANDSIFHPIRIEPYLLATAEAHPDCAARLHELATITENTKRALMHGDVSPKNILIGPHGPVFLDAECACYGDPAFDVAFCLNHLLLKCVWRPQWTDRYLESFDALAGAYLDGVAWEPQNDIERRTAHLLGGLMLGRIDGKSPVEYITVESERETVRHFARSLLLLPIDRLSEIRDRWQGVMAP